MNEKREMNDYKQRRHCKQCASFVTVTLQKIKVIKKRCQRLVLQHLVIYIIFKKVFDFQRQFLFNEPFFNQFMRIASWEFLCD